MDDILHLIATGGNAVSTLACCFAIWFIFDLRSDLRDFRSEVQALREEAKGNATSIAELTGELRGIQSETGK